MVYNKRTSGLPLICLVCGDVARGINFDLMTCMSCKIFFRRHALKSSDILQCRFASECQITRQTRANCSACRLKKCFALGMKRELIRNSAQYQTNSNHYRRGKIMEQSSNRLPKPLPLSLLRNDRSTLTTDDWTLLSNITHAYDAVNIIPQTKYLLQQQAALPPKIRSKSSTAVDVIKFFHSTFQSFVERSPYFHDLSVDARRALILHNAETTGAFHTLFIMREINALDNFALVAGYHTIYGHDVIRHLNKLVSRVEQNGMLVKVMLLIMAFASNCSIVTHHYSENIRSISSAAPLINIQNIFVTMFWKYLIYQYGFDGAVRCFSSLIKYVLNILQIANEQTNTKHGRMIDTIVEESTRSLTLYDRNMNKTLMEF